MRYVDCIIVGSGIAGITLAWELYNKNKTFVIISNPQLSKSSVIAPGVWNPIIFKRITPTWNASQLINTLIPFYQKIENILKHQLLLPLEILHYINNENEKKLWRQKQELYPKFLQDIIYLNKSQYSFLIDDNCICGKVISAGRLNVSEYIYYSIEFFKSIHAYTENNFYHNTLIINNNKVEYENWLASNIIFCEGYLIKDNPYFKFALSGLKPAKGEIIEIETEYSILPENTILHKQISIIPNGKNKYLIGSNYEWKQLDEKPTQSIKEKFLSHFESIFNVSYQVIGHYAGVRPAAIDRRPILGKHPKLSNVYIFNGLGTKGVMLAPCSTQYLFNLIFYNKVIDKEMNVERFLN